MAMLGHSVLIGREGEVGTFPSLKFPITLRKITDFDYRETPSFVLESKPKNGCRSRKFSIHDPQISLFY
jgi:hypothetical protein